MCYSNLLRCSINFPQAISVRPFGPAVNSWRREWDSNPRVSCPTLGFRDQPGMTTSVSLQGIRRSTENPKRLGCELRPNRPFCRKTQRGKRSRMDTQPMGRRWNYTVVENNQRKRLHKHKTQRNLCTRTKKIT
ncbi:MAG: hypothetical protein UV16_C0007G0071 [candidate division WWE3 bacterium GW2011_GWE2_42_25]|nr:MAG: hypothetical protein UV16_C0007G0071 [candidate division WWE3 bacterium GW2011_GWE2_42_25]